MSPARAGSTPAPYRILFPIGFAFAIGGAVPWILSGLGVVPYPAVLHREWMMQGFETSFVLGFLLTSIPAFTHGEPCRPWELAGAIAGPLLFAAFSLAGNAAAAQMAFLVTLAGLVLAVARRAWRAELRPPEEFLFVATGLALGLAGGVFQLGSALGAWTEPAPRFGIRLIALGMLLALVLGLGTLLVPVFAGMRDPLVIPGVAGAHERRGRRGLYAVLALLLVGSFVAEARGAARLGAILRLTAATPLGILGWKLTRLPGRRAAGAWAMWIAGWMVLAGLGLAAAFPGHAVGFQHLVFIGGYGMLTAAIGARVVIGHGRHPVADEVRVLGPGVLGLFAGAVATRIAAEFVTPPAALHAASAALWIAAWLPWSAGAFPRIARLSVAVNPPGIERGARDPVTTAPARSAAPARRGAHDRRAASTVSPGVD